MSTVDRRTGWESATAVPLVAFGVGFIVSYSLLVLVSAPPAWLTTVAGAVLAVSWFAFLLDYVVRLMLTAPGGRWGFVTHNVGDLLAVLVPVFRALRVVRLLRGIPYFQRKTGDSVRAEIVSYAIAYAVLFVYFISLATLQVERTAPGATITDFGQAIWWACVTLATVGYGDTYPVTTLGRVYAVLLMFGGVAIVGTASALVISFINDRVTQRVKRD